MKLRIRKWRNSAAIRLPAKLLKQIDAAIGDAVELDTQALHVARPKYKLADLLAKCNKNAPSPTDLISWESMNKVGTEIV
ncbi:AbrB/MazE/SpoVT family DNA-binding domain-containing protein [Methylotenera sp.]|uniref:AbrB/MazE/SpoVT family DNA-binding domain-containing protein n=1 Tax=Methylotenera sp. TaxID=2051956 RepID=UPI002EDA14DB